MESLRYYSRVPYLLLPTVDTEELYSIVHATGDVDVLLANEMGQSMVAYDVSAGGLYLHYFRCIINYSFYLPLLRSLCVLTFCINQLVHCSRF